MQNSTPTHQVFEASESAMIYTVHVVLNREKCEVVVGSGEYYRDEPPEKLKLKKKTTRLNDPTSAELFFRCQLASLPAGYRVVRGEAVQLSPDEDYKSVKPKSQNYLYLENQNTQEFWDIDLDETLIIMWQGSIDSKGIMVREDCDWDGEAEERYAELIEEKKTEGFAPID